MICSPSLVHLCERPVKEEKFPVLRLAVFTGYLTYGIYPWHYDHHDAIGRFCRLAQRIASSLHFEL